MEILVGEKIKISIYSNIDLNNIIWTSDNDNIKIENGLVTGLKTGTSIITINIDGKIYYCDVTIKDTIDIFHLNTSYVKLKENEEFLVEANAPMELINFKIYDNNIAIFKDNKIKALNKGKTLLEATLFNKTYYVVIYVGEYNINYKYDYNTFVTFFNEVALSNEYINNIDSKKIQKWNSPIYYNCLNATEEDLNKIKQLSDTLNQIPGFPGMYYNQNNYNLTINFTTYEYLYGITKVQGVEGYSLNNFTDSIIYNSNIYINSSLDRTTKNSVISEEILHSIGLKNDTKAISNSVLYEYGSIVEEPTDYDLLAAYLLYSEHINYGMSDIMVNKKLEEILK